MDVRVFKELLDEERRVGRMTGTLQDNHLVQFLGHHPGELCGVPRRWEVIQPNAPLVLSEERYLGETRNPCWH